MSESDERVCLWVAAAERARVRFYGDEFVQTVRRSPSRDVKARQHSKKDTRRTTDAELPPKTLSYGQSTIKPG